MQKCVHARVQPYITLWHTLWFISAMPINYMWMDFFKYANDIEIKLKYIMVWIKMKEKNTYEKHKYNHDCKKIIITHSSLCLCANACRLEKFVALKCVALQNWLEIFKWLAIMIIWMLNETRACAYARNILLNKQLEAHCK